nr:immunoglobulin light chain junction region [Macaca mulatta]MOY02409.1 immunoglobulin light chain junction region [Macaca mulatta]
CMQGIESPFTF